MKTIFSTFAAAFVTLTAFAQVTSETRTVIDFTGVRTGSIISLELTQGEACAVVLEGDAEDIRDVKTDVVDGMLVITGGIPRHDEGIKAKVTVKNLRVLDLSGASNTTCTNQLRTDSLQVQGSGAATAKLDVQADRIKANLAGASNVRFMGTARTLDAHLSGAAQLKGYQLETENTYVTTSGAASARVNATKVLEASATGASDIHYQGGAPLKTINASGSSSISMREGDGKESDTTAIRIGDYDVHVTERDVDDERSRREQKADDDDFEFWSGIDFGVNGYLTSDNKVELPAGFEFLELNYAKSYVFGANLFQKNIHIYRNNVNLGTGIGLTWYHYNFRNSYSLTPDVPYATATYDSVKYSKNRLNMCYVNIPLFLEFNTNNKDASKSFHFGAGMQFGYNVFHNKLKQKYELGGQDNKRKIKDDFNVNPFRYDVIARVGYGKFTVFGTYSLSTLFERGNGPVVYPFAAGINFGF